MRAGARLSDADQAALRALNDGGVVAQHRVRAAAARGDEGRRARRRARRASSRGLSDGRARRRRRRREGARARGQVGPAAAEHDAAAGAGLAVRAAPRASASSPHRRGAPSAATTTTRARSCSASPSCARTRPGSSGSQLRGLRARRPDGRDAGEGDRAADGPGPRRPREGERRGGADAGARRREDGGGGFNLAPWDWQYYAEQVRKAEYALDDERIKPYLELERVLRDGVFFAAHELYGLTFHERRDLPVVSPRRARLRGASTPTALSLALFYADYFKRDNKTGGAWMSSFVDAVGAARHAAGRLQRLQLHQARARAAGAAHVRRRAHDVPRVRPRAARHVLERDVPEPRGHQRAARLRRVPVAVQRALGVGPRRVRELREAPPDGRAHAGGAGGEGREGAQVQPGLRARRSTSQPRCSTWRGTRCPTARAVRTSRRSRQQPSPRAGVDFALVPPRYRTTYFAHVWGGGYAASYYAYMWSEVLDDDAYRWFVEHGGMTRENGQRFRELILSRGHTQDAGGAVPRVPRARPERGAAAGAAGARVTIRSARRS